MIYHQSLHYVHSITNGASTLILVANTVFVLLISSDIGTGKLAKAKLSLAIHEYVFTYYNTMLICQIYNEFV